MRKHRTAEKRVRKYTSYRGRRPGTRALRIVAAVLLVLTALAVGLLLGSTF